LFLGFFFLTTAGFEDKNGDKKTKDNKNYLFSPYTFCHFISPFTTVPSFS